MPNLLDQGSRHLTAQMFRHAASEVVYLAGAGEVVVKAIIGKRDRHEDEVETFGTSYEERDFLIRVADLVLEGESIVPAKGDQIRITENNQSQLYEVLPRRSSEPPWQWSDLYREVYRIHTKYQGITP